MIAGALEFQIGGNASELVNATNTGQLALDRLNASATAADTHGLGNLLKGTKGVHLAMVQMGHAMSEVGFAAAPQLTMGVHAAASSMKALKLLMTSTELGFGALGVAGLGAAAVFATWSSGISAFHAFQVEIASQNDLLSQQGDLREHLIKQLERMDRIGRGGPLNRWGETQAQERINAFAFAGNSPDYMAAAIKKAQVFLQGINAQDKKTTAGDELKDFLAPLRNRLLEGTARQKADLSLELDKLISQASQLAGAAGFDQDKLAALFNQIKGVEFARIDAAVKAPTTHSFHATAVTSIEKMGGVLSGLGRGFGNDSTRDIANNTRKTNDLLNKVIETIKPGSSGDYANRD